MNSSHDLCAATGLSYRQLDYWIRRGVILEDEPRLRGIGGVTGSGSVRRFSDREVRVVLLLAELRALGMGCAALGAAARQARSWADAEWQGPAFVGPAGEISREARSRTLVVDLSELASRLEVVPA